MTFPRPCPCCSCRIVTRYTEPDDSRPGATLTGLTCDACGLRTLPYQDGDKALRVWNKRDAAPRTVIDSTEKGGREL
jgi:hypothetical protein